MRRRQGRSVQRRLETQHRPGRGVGARGWRPGVAPPVPVEPARKVTTSDADLSAPRRRLNRRHRRARRGSPAPSTRERDEPRSTDNGVDGGSPVAALAPVSRARERGGDVLLERLLARVLARRGHDPDDRRAAPRRGRVGGPAAEDRVSHAVVPEPRRDGVRSGRPRNGLGRRRDGVRHRRPRPRHPFVDLRPPLPPSPDRPPGNVGALRGLVLSRCPVRGRARRGRPRGRPPLGRVPRQPVRAARRGRYSGRSWAG